WTATPVGGPGNANNGTSIDQVIAALIAASPSKTYLPSLQVGLSTMNSSGDGLPFQHSRSMAWKSPTEPLYKTVNPQAVFDQLVAGRPTNAPGAMPDPAADKRRALRKSALDYILQSSTSLQARLSRSDKVRLDSFLTSVRSLETQVTAVASTMSS